MLYSPCRIYGYVVVLILVGCCAALGQEENEHKPQLDDRFFHGEINENERLVQLHPALVAHDDDEGDAGKICGYKIKGKDIPFDVEVDENTGEGFLKAREPADCESRREFTFEIQAFDCGLPEKYSKKASVHIEVNDVNEHMPYFTSDGYEADIDEGKLYEKIIQLEANDDDCSSAFSQICDYEIVTPSVPFNISREGLIRNTEALSHERSSDYILAVRAYDCGGKRSTTVLVTINVNKICTPGWQGVPTRIEYEAGSGRKQIAPAMYLETCTAPVCEDSYIEATISLETDHIGKGCDRDTYSEKSLRKLCGASSGSIELLPSPGTGHSWTEDLQTDEGKESDQIYEFDGETTAVMVPDDIVPQNLTEHFTISTWMKHGPNYGEGKETILCNSDKAGLNRHHMSLYVHNCRLVFLLRRDYGNLETFRPAEFRWKIDQVCDKAWHHYVLNVNFPEVILYVDGEEYEPHHITEDWPLHRTSFSTQLTVGAAWEGADGEYVQHLKGYLAGLTIRPGSTESQRVISCLHGCKESLEFHAFDLLEPGQEATLNPTQSSLTLKGKLIGDNFINVMQRVAYINTRQFPTPGKRALTIHTKAQCDGTDILIPDLDTYVMVLQPPEPTITITGTQHHAHKVSDFQSGIPLFNDVHIVSVLEEEQEDGEEESSLDAVNIAHNLDSCAVKVSPPLDFNHEKLDLPMPELEKWRLEQYNTTGELVIRGVDSITNYEDVLRNIVYINTDAGKYFDRVFTLECSELNGRYTSNTLQVQINVLHTSFPGPKVNHDKGNEHMKVNFKHNSISKQEIGKDPSSSTKGIASKTGTAMTAVIVACVGFLVFMIVLGIFRIRAAHRRAQVGDDRQEMAWDDDSLTITVNPMQSMEYDDQEFHPQEDSDSSDDDDDDSSCHDDMDSSEDEGEPSKEHQLEWDDSTLTF
ncbi:calsyntenin-1-like [Ptychodera flava]|uniref:calsyntenin-1-like n=1 Tax=Ptychodera flava TaxID=63121 RepID=UPI00396A1F0D